MSGSPPCFLHWPGSPQSPHIHVQALLFPNHIMVHGNCKYDNFDTLNYLHWQIEKCKLFVWTDSCSILYALCVELMSHILLLLGSMCFLDFVDTSLLDFLVFCDLRVPGGSAVVQVSRYSYIRSLNCSRKHVCSSPYYSIMQDPAIHFFNSTVQNSTRLWSTLLYSVMPYFTVLHNFCYSTLYSNTLGTSLG